MGTMGEGYVQMEGEDAQLIKAGDVVVIPAGTKHWHGATHNSQFTHISVSGPVVDYNTEWLEPVSQEEYDKLD
jgi:quercetin dioxygenase-like cupin family protein